MSTEKALTTLNSLNHQTACGYILTLFLKKEIDGTWVPEPCTTMLVNEANGRIFVDEGLDLTRQANKYWL